LYSENGRRWGDRKERDTDHWDPKTFSRSQFLEVEDATAQVGTSPHFGTKHGINTTKRLQTSEATYTVSNFLSSLQYPAE